MDGRIIRLDGGGAVQSDALNEADTLVWARDGKSILSWQCHREYFKRSSVSRVALDGKTLKRWTKDVRHPRAVAETSDGTPAAIISVSGSVGFWRAGAPEVPLAVSVHSPALALFSPDGKRLAVVRANGGLRVLSSATLQTRAEIVRYRPGLSVLKGWTRDGKQLVTDEVVLDARTLNTVGRLPDKRAARDFERDFLSDPAWSPRSGMLVTRSNIRRTDGKVVALPRPCERACLSPNCKRVAMVCEQTLYVLDTATGKVLRRVPVATTDTSSFNSNSVFWTPNGKTILAGDIGLGMGVFDAATLRKRGTMFVLGNGRTLMISADGHYRGSPGVEKDLVAIVDTGKERLLLTPAEFAKRFKFKNDPDRALLLGPDAEP
jgi:WD40 repeat protein